MKVDTKIGQLNFQEYGKKDGNTLVFLHGVFFDHTLWQTQIDRFSISHRIIAVDMLGHGLSQNVKKNWSLDDCVKAVHEAISKLDLNNITLVGHSWGSMTALRLINKYPENYNQAVLFNMPVHEARGMTRIGFYMQLTMSPFKKFYAKQAAKSLYSKEYLQQNPEATDGLVKSMSIMSPQQIRQTVKSVILNCGDASDLVQNTGNTSFYVGKEDYVKNQYPIEPTVLNGGHISPHESSVEVNEAITKALA